MTEPLGQRLNENLGERGKKIRSWMRPAETRFKEPFGGTCAWLISSQRSVLVCMSCPLRGSRRRTFTSTRPPVGFRPFITWKEERVRRLIAVKHGGDSAPRPTCPPHFDDLSDFALRLQFVQLHHRRPDGLVAPQETSGGRDNPTAVSGNLYGIPLARRWDPERVGHSPLVQQLQFEASG